LVTDNIARNIVAQNKVAQKSEYATKLADASGRVY